MFGIGMTELMVILVIGLVVIGPKKLPGLARSLGKSLAEFRHASDEMRRDFLDVTQSARVDPPDTDDPTQEKKESAEAPRPDATPSGGTTDATPDAANPRANDVG